MVESQPGDRPACWILCSSGARPLYLENIVRVLGLPAGELVKFRYESEIVSASFKKLVEEGIPLGAARVTGDIAYLAYLDIGDRLTTPRVYPVREARIRSVTLLGTTYVIQLELLCFLDWAVEPLDKIVRESATDELPSWDTCGRDDDEKIRCVGHWVAASNALPGKVLIPYSASRHSHLPAFESTVRAISQGADFRDGKRLFVNFFGPYDSSHRALQPNDALKAGQRYELHLYHYQHCEERSAHENFRLRASTDNDDVLVVGAIEKLVEARYDQVIFPFRVKEDAKDGPVSLGVDVLRIDKGSTDFVYILRGDIQRLVKSNRARKIWFGLMIGIGLFGTQAVTLVATQKFSTGTAIWALAFSLFAGLAATFQIKTKV